MKSFPMFIRTTGRRVVVAGGWEQAAQKTRLLLKTDAHIEVLAPDLDDELAELAASGKITHTKGPITEASFRGAAMGFIATGCPGWMPRFMPLRKPRTSRSMWWISRICVI